MNKKEITFKNVSDFRKRIASLWIEQLEGEIYEFIFLCPYAQKEFENLISRFHQDMIENPRN